MTLNDDPERKRRMFLDEWKTAVESQESDRRSLNEGATNFAQSVLRSGFILNGGVLVLFPAYVQLLGISIGSQISNVIVSGAAFVCGLLFVWFASFFGYFTLVLQASSVHWAREKATKTLESSFYPDRRDKGLGIEDFERRRCTTYVLSEVCRWIAISLSLLCVLAFVYGVYVSWKIVGTLA